MSLASTPTISIVLATHQGRQAPIIKGVPIPRSSFLNWTVILNLLGNLAMEGWLHVELDREVNGPIYEVVSISIIPYNFQRIIAQKPRRIIQ